MSEQIKYKNHEEIIADLKIISPLALPGYLRTCEYYDESDAFETLEKAEAQFREKGGIAKNIVEATLKTTANAVVLCMLRKFNEPLYKKVVKTRTTDFSNYLMKAWTFELADYGEPDEVGSLVNERLEQDFLRRNIVEKPGVPNADRKSVV